MLHSWSSSTYFSQIIELIFTLIILLIGWTAPTKGADGFQWVESQITRLSRNSIAAAITIFTGIIVARVLLLPFIPVPKPSVHDEFSYLLAAQTFAAGRLTNLPPAFREHFESIHILLTPSYTSMYPPAQGLCLAAGLRLFGVPWIGVLLSVALLCTATFWTLRAWFSTSWAFAGTLLAVARWGLTSYWMNSYWGGAVPALGGALLLGGTARLLPKARPLPAVAAGLGIAILANSRPYEGSALVVISLTILLVLKLRGRTVTDLLKPSVLLPFFSILLVTAAAMLFYNSRVTGNPLRLPYLEDRSHYAFAPLFIWGHLRPEPTYKSASLRRVYEAEATLFQTTREEFGIPEIVRKAKNIWIFFCGPLLTIPVLALMFLRTAEAKKERAKHILWKAALIGASLTLIQVVWFYPHYAAPFFSAWLAMLVYGLQRLRRWRPKARPVGLFLSRMIPAGCLLMAALPAIAYAQHWKLSYWPLQWALGTPRDIHPASLQKKVLQDGKKALIFVHYGPNHDVGEEWVYNSADFQSSPIIWAREVSPESDRALAQYYAARGRKVWVVYPDQPSALNGSVKLLPFAQ